MKFEFESAIFLPVLPEESQANPGVYGFELALWLAQVLSRKGLATSYPVGEDWGWFIDCRDGRDEWLVECASVCGMGDGYRGQPVSWAIVVKSAKPRFLRMWRKARSPSEVETTLVAAIGSALTAERIEWTR